MKFASSNQLNLPRLGATTYPCKEEWDERRQTESEVDKRLEELDSILNETRQHRFRMLNLVVASINSWIIQVGNMSRATRWRDNQWGYVWGLGLVHPFGPGYYYKH